MIDFYRLDSREAAWTLVAPCEGEFQRLLITGTAGLPIAKDGDHLRCSFVDAPNPVVLDGEAGALQVRSSDLRLYGQELGLVSIIGSISTEWTALSLDKDRRPFTITLKLEAKLRI